VGDCATPKIANLVGISATQWGQKLLVWWEIVPPAKIDSAPGNSANQIRSFFSFFQKCSTI